uniref:LIM domain 7 n=1 Tax=Naja naja TaxID=35670 RepID=A0A8C7E1E3_NAJNA
MTEPRADKFAKGCKPLLRLWSLLSTPYCKSNVYVYLLYLSQFLFLRALQKYSEDYLNSDHRAKADPSSGPRLITCRKYNYLRPGYDQRIHEIRDFYPDLENDDLFVRKTGASHANPVVLQDFEYLRRSCQPRPRIEGEIVLQPRDEEDETIPDLEKDDLTVRKAQLHKKEVPLSGAPDKYQPALFPDPWTLPPEIQAKFLSEGKVLSPSSRQKKDDMLTRKMELLSLGGNAQSKSFCPGACSKEDMEKWEAIREASKTRHKKRQMVERLLQKISEEHGSKSLNDVSADELQTIRQMRYEELQKIKTQLREQDQQWQDDLAKWKSRRRSHTSDLQRKKEEREEIERRSSESSERRSKTLREMQRDRNSWQETEQMYLSNDDVFREEKASPKVCVPTEANGGLKKEDDHELRNRKPERGAKEEPLASVDSLAGERMESTLPSSQTSNAQTGSGRVSASLSRSYQKADTARLTSVVTPRPFGAPMRGISSLPRSFTVKTGFCLKVWGSTSVQGQGKMEPQVAEDSKTRTSHLPEEQRRGTPESEPKSDHHTSSNSMTVSSSAPKEKILSVTEESRRHEQYSDMRISINQKPGSSRNFGFTVSQNPSGVFVKSIEEGSPAEFCQLKQGEWEAAISRALENGRLVMDVRRHGKKGTPENKCIDATSGDRTSTQSQQIQTTTLQQHCGFLATETTPNNNDSNTLDIFNKIRPHHTLTCLYLRIFFQIDTEPISLKNLKRRSQFFEQGKSNQYSPTPPPKLTFHLPVPPIAAPSRWTWDQEEERKRQEKWQAEQERLLQEQYKREQERLKEEWLKAQQEAEKDISSYLKEVSSQPFCGLTSLAEIWLKKKFSEQSWNTTNSLKRSQKEQGLSAAELERQQILQEMKKRTSLHTDSSWIRQRNSSVHKEPFSLTGTRMRRGESLDNLDSSRTNSWRPHSWMNQSASSTSLSSSQEFGQHIPPVVSTSNRAYMRTPSSSLPSPSSASMKTSSLPHIPPSSSVPQAPSSVSGKRMCSSCRNALGKGAAMIIESLGLCYHLHCFKCVACEGDLGGSQAGAEVRIRNNELFCNSCYLRFKSKMLLL